MSNFEFNISSANSDTRIINPRGTPADVSNIMQRIKCILFNFKDSSNTELGFDSTSIIESEFNLPITNVASVKQPEIIPSKMAVLLDPSGTNERVSFSFEGSDICGNSLFKMIITDPGLNLQLNTVYRFIMSEASVSSTITREMLNSDPATYLPLLKKTSIPEIIYDISSNEGNAYEYTLKVPPSEGNLNPDIFPYNEILLYGEQTSDFKLVNKDTIFALHHLAIQELLRN
jgi:hypothetical protein